MKNVIITGAANGVGKAIAETLKDENLILVDNDMESLIKIANELNKEYFVCDLSNDEEIERVINQINDKRVDCLIK